MTLLCLLTSKTESTSLVNGCCGNTVEVRGGASTSQPLLRSVGGSGGQASREGPPPVALRLSLVSGPGPREASVLSHRRGNELQLEVLLEDAVESRATLGATEWPVALAASALGEFCQEGQPGTSSVQMTQPIKCLDLLWIQNRF